MTELIDKSLRSLGFLHDPLFVVLPERPGQLVVVHCRPVLALAPQRGNPRRVHDLEDALFAFHPVDAAGVQVRGAQQFLDELPQVDVGVGRGTAFLNRRPGYSGYVAAVVARSAFGAD